MRSGSSARKVTDLLTQNPVVKAVSNPVEHFKNRRKAWVTDDIRSKTRWNNILNNAGFALEVGASIAGAGLFLYYAGGYAVLNSFSSSAATMTQLQTTAAQYGLWQKAALFTAASGTVGALVGANEPVINLGKKPK